MKILIYGPRARYDLYTPAFVSDLAVELVFSGAHQSTLQAARANPDAEVIFADAITPVSREVIECLPRLKMIHSLDIDMFYDKDKKEYYCIRCQYTGTEQDVLEKNEMVRFRYRRMMERITDFD